MGKKFCWTEEKQEELRKMWNSYSLTKLASYFHTSIENIKLEAIELGLDEYKSNRWTKEEEKLLQEYASKYVIKTIARKLGRSCCSVKKKALKMGIELHAERDPWKKWMIDYLKDNINKIPIGQIQEVLGLGYNKIVAKCYELGIEYIKESWTPEEIEILKKYAPTCHYTELTKVLPRRSVGAITAKAHELGIKTVSINYVYNEEEAKFIRDNWGKMPATEIARQLKTSIGVINGYKKKLGLPNIYLQKKWTPEVIEKLRIDAKTKTRQELAKKYKTSAAQIANIASENNIVLINSKRLWNDELDRRLTMLFEQQMSINSIADEIGIKARLVRKRINQLGLSDKVVGPRCSWTEEEVLMLRNLSSEKSLQELAQILNKTDKQVYRKARRLGIEVNSVNPRLWSDEEVAKLLSIYNQYDFHVVAQMLNRCESAVRSKLKELGLTAEYKKTDRWTKEEEALLREYAQKFTVNEIAVLLNRSCSSVMGKLRYIGVKALNSPRNWSDDEIKLLQSLAGDKSVEEIAVILNKSSAAISAKLNQLNEKKNTAAYKVWTSEEEKLLGELLATHSPAEVAKILERSEDAIIVRATKIGYKINHKHKRWTREEELILSDLWGTLSIDKIAKKLNRSVSSVRNRATKLELGPQIESNYDGIKIQDLVDMFQVNRSTILTSWVSLGLKLDVRQLSNSRAYSFVQISNLYEFLQANQNIWDSRLLEENILGIEPDWLREKRKKDQNAKAEDFNLDNLTKQQLLQAKKYFLDLSAQSTKTNAENSTGVIGDAVTAMEEAAIIEEDGDTFTFQTISGIEDINEESEGENSNDSGPKLIKLPGETKKW